MCARFFDAMEKDFLAAYPECKPIFEDGLEKELIKLFGLNFFVKYE